MKIFGLSAFIVILDQVTKVLTRSLMDFGDSIPVIKNFFHITHITNDGMAFGIDMPFGSYLLPIITAGLILFLIKMILDAQENSIVYQAGLGLILGGAIGNFIDRILFGKVTDFLHFMVGDWEWYIFNIADSGVSVGFALVLYFTFFIQPKTNPQS
ncbi:MAG: signal peptidase II [Candidatus Marinimicrobia bacterium]|jgi:signal peptidase II|nr:signal peptidase II [Candidatus Neomarinimicrobiota bacterium]MBT3618635.1 signal peptidase II [Candidatus Neomarinimicrobiota bacterium]MBT3829667.1 signal peptidase II [Candidatus Neomarinimicrobiota bacterium]MBT3997384.1 signal peptidase II [Candidatus Neomarinimicrobiota bacterium]MBT4280441.1 signal peptidase II [Candidatus Neomarinimicrobiota bacterium]